MNLKPILRVENETKVQGEQLPTIQPLNKWTSIIKFGVAVIYFNFLFQFGKIHLLTADANVIFNYIWLWSIMKIISWGVQLQAAIYRNISNNILLVIHVSVICEVALVNMLDSCIYQQMQYKISYIFLAYKHHWEKERKFRQYYL